MSDFEDAVYDQASEDAQVNRYIEQGQYQKARNRIWQIAQKVAEFFDHIATIVNAVNTVLSWLGIK